MTGEAGLLRGCCADAFAYSEIANAFPPLPDERSRPIGFHHAQRFVVPWLAGGLP